jgi:type II secretory pathway pseudopilin PulG
MMQKRIIFYSIGIFIIAMLVAIILPVFGRVKIERPSKTQLQIADLIFALKNYKSVYGVYPTGESSNIVGVLAGDNPQKTVFLNFRRTMEHPNEMVDSWEMPYKIEFSQQTNFIIRSAGKDKIFGDADDIIFNSASNGFVKP